RKNTGLDRAWPGGRLLEVRALRRQPFDNRGETLRIERVAVPMMEMLQVPLRTGGLKRGPCPRNEIAGVRGQRVVIRGHHEELSGANASHQVVKIKVFEKAGDDERHLKSGAVSKFVSIRAGRPTQTGEGNSGVQGSSKQCHVTAVRVTDES